MSTNGRFFERYCSSVGTGCGMVCGGQLLKDRGETVVADAMTHLPTLGRHAPRKAHGLLTPGTDEAAVALAGEGLARGIQHLAGLSDEHAGVLNQAAAGCARVRCEHITSPGGIVTLFHPEVSHEFLRTTGAGG